MAKIEDNLPFEKIKYIKENCDKMYIKDIASELNLSISTLKRYAYKNKIRFSFYSKNNCYQQQLISDVIAYWLVNGKAATVKKFPNVKVRSIIERHNNGRSTIQRYTFNDKLFLLRYSEFLGTLKSARILGRVVKERHNTRLNSFNNRKNTTYRVNYNGLTKRIISRFLIDGKSIKLNYHGRSIITWPEIAKNLKVDNQNLLILAQAMAKFQIWLHGGQILTEEKLICQKLQK